jgi:phage gpG-like protein
MGASASGGDLRELRTRLSALASGGFRTETAQVLGATAKKLVADEFLRSKDPYGGTWDPLKSRRGKPLLRTGRMRNSVAVEQTSLGFRIRVTAKYSVFHQDGTKPHQRAARVARQSARGRFISAKTRTVRSKSFEGTATRSGYLVRIKAHTNTGIPRRQMLPERETGGLGPIWVAAFNREAASLIRRRLRRAA